jgi:hypothetical protein
MADQLGGPLAKERMERASREMGMALVAVGVVIALFCGLAEVLGIGGGSFGWKQLVGVIAGCLVAIVGLFIVFSQSSASEPNR